ncbi:hypothetical protein N9N67_02860 [Bacteriovoracaceae bacterium]|nr:hypothetical protein [Bacteriovoracaceae bacterium]
MKKIIYILSLFSFSAYSQGSNFLDYDEFYNLDLEFSSVVDFFNQASIDSKKEKQQIKKENIKYPLTIRYPYATNFQPLANNKFISAKIRSTAIYINKTKGNKIVNGFDGSLFEKTRNHVYVTPFKSDYNKNCIAEACEVDGQKIIEKVYYIDLVDSQNIVYKAVIILMNQEILANNNVSDIEDYFDGFYIADAYDCGFTFCEVYKGYSFLAINGSNSLLRMKDSKDREVSDFKFGFLVYKETDTENAVWVDATL